MEFAQFMKSMNFWIVFLNSDPLPVMDESLLKLSPEIENSKYYWSNTACPSCDNYTHIRCYKFKESFNHYLF